MEENETSVIRNATLKKFNELLDRQSYITKQIEALNQEALTVDEGIQGCRTVAKLFHFDLPEPVEERGEQQHAAISLLPSGPAGSPPKPGTRQKSVSDGTVKDFVLKHLEAIYPETVRSRNLQEMYERETGQNIHEKTMGMTLYRLLKDELVSRDGWNWRFNPGNTPSALAEETATHKDDLLTDNTAGDSNDDLQKGGQHALAYGL